MIIYIGPTRNSSLAKPPFQDADNIKIISLQHMTEIDAQ